MEKKTECEIVQDLLLGYVDGVLNEESKKLVERHLSECSGCKKRLQEIIRDIDENEKDEKIKIDYLKKIRRKNKIKSVLMAIGIIFTICLAIYLYKFATVSNFMSKTEKALQNNNFYKETMQVGSGFTSVTKEYYKDGKYKNVWEIYTDNGLESTRTEYRTENSETMVTIDEKTKKVTIEKGKFIEMTNKNLRCISFTGDRITDDGGMNLFLNLGTAWWYSIHTDHYGSNKEYYVLREQFAKTKGSEIWIDKETGLTIKMITKDAIKEAYSGTGILKEVRDSIVEYKYEFGIVKDEDVEIPSFDGYEVEYKTNEELDKLLIE